MSDPINVATEITNFLSADIKKYHFPAAWKVPLFTREESDLLRVAADYSHDAQAFAAKFGANLGQGACNPLCILGIRSAIHGLRSGNAQDLQIAINFISLVAEKMDSRDLLGVYAIFIECCTRLGLDSAAIAVPVLRSVKLNLLWFEGLLELPPVKRRLVSYGMEAVELPEGISFRTIGEY